jgi:hypothetical protein
MLSLSLRSVSIAYALVLIVRLRPLGHVYTRKLVSKFPSFPRAHHPIIRDSTSIWEFTGLVLVQAGNRGFQDSCIQVCKSRLLAALLVSQLLFCGGPQSSPDTYPLEATTNGDAVFTLDNKQVTQRISIRLVKDKSSHMQRPTSH